ncbi:spermidine synthase [Geomesophilobacter sediminis]|uniref:Spermidine synthase n=1 Tax=Geomesophilobacter sediminis TaxID=2798584 RepID=A0A8J7M311_9BACT|nr:spermidine synthase [Geomesophilobacter sediminis]MBJ6727599.1 spermidine synthase [Geomesophilobacter sediminis]
MAQPWKVLDRIETEEGPLELRQRGARDFLITIGTQVLMNSALHRSEMALGELACGHLKDAAAPRVLVGGLGMAFTLRAVLDQLPPTAEVVVAELNPVVVTWCRGPLAELTAGAVNDPRVKVEIGDVAAIIRKRSGSPERFDAVVFDLYRGPHAKTDKIADPLYGSVAIEVTRSVLKTGGIFAIWGENYDAAFDKRLQAAGFSVSSHRPGYGGLRHVVFLAKMKAREAGRRR